MIVGLAVDWGDVPAWGALLVAIFSALCGAIVAWQRWRTNYAITWETNERNETTMVLRNTSSRAVTNVVVDGSGEEWHVKSTSGSLTSIGANCSVELIWTDPGRKRRPNQVLVSCDEQKKPVAVPTPW